MNFNIKNTVKAANLVLTTIILSTLFATIWHLPDPWAIDLLKLLVGGAVSWLLVKEAKNTDASK